MLHLALNLAGVLPIGKKGTDNFLVIQTDSNILDFTRTLYIYKMLTSSIGQRANSRVFPHVFVVKTTQITINEQR